MNGSPTSKRTKIGIYCAIPEAEMSLAYPRTSRDELRRHIRLAFGHLLWRFANRFFFNSYDNSGYLESNSGDIAIRESIIDIIDRRWPGREFDLIEIKWGELEKINPDEFLAVFFSGSGYLFLSDFPNFTPRVQKDIEFIERAQLRDRVFLLGIGMNRPGESLENSAVSNLPDSTKALLRRLCANAATIGVRDQSTLDALLEAVPGSNPSLVADPALFLQHGHRKAPNGSHQPRISINLPFHGPLATEILRNRLNEFCNAIGTIQQRYSAEISYCQHHDAESILPSLLREKGLSVHHVYHGSTAQLLHGYSRQDLHIGHMLHSCILATACDTPSIGLAYDSKSFGFFELLHMRESCIHYSDWTTDWLVERASAILEAGPAARDRIAQRRTQLWSDWEALLDRIDPYIA